MRSTRRAKPFSRQHFTQTGVGEDEIPAQIHQRRHEAVGEAIFRQIVSHIRPTARRRGSGTIRKGREKGERTLAYVMLDPFGIAFGRFEVKAQAE